MYVISDVEVNSSYSVSVALSNVNGTGPFSINETENSPQEGGEEREGGRERGVRGREREREREGGGGERERETCYSSLVCHCSVSLWQMLPVDIAGSLLLKDSYINLSRLLTGMINRNTGCIIFNISHMLIYQ